MKIADLCCCGGLAADGYASVGFQPEGWDIVDRSKHYPYPFKQADALAWLGQAPYKEVNAYAAIHTSWPCQLFTRAKHLRTAQGGKSKETVDLLTPGLAILRDKWGHKPWIVENVDDKEALAIMQPRGREHLTKLCGSMFGLKVQRHRWFLTNFPVPQMKCDHSRFEPDPVSGKPRPWGVYHVPGDMVPSGGRTARNAEHGREVMGSWRTLPWDLLKEGFPPQYTAYIGAHLLREVMA